METKLKLIIFDFWKTLAFAPNYNPQRFYSLLGNFGIEIKGKDKIKRLSSLFFKLMCSSKNWRDLSLKLLKNFSKKQNQENIIEFANFLKQNMAYKIYDDVKDVLKLPYERAILTDSSRFLVENSGLKDFAKIFTPNETKALKPNPEAFLTVLNDFKIKPQEAVMVGDSIERDLMPAENLGMKTILIDREDRFKDYQGIRIGSLRELEKMLENIKGL